MPTVLKIANTCPAGKTVPLLALGLCTALVLTGCGPATPGDSIYDPSEAQNRQFHDFNVNSDKNVVRPVSQVYAKVVPQPLAIGVSNFTGNLNLPDEVVNDVLQLKLDHAAQNTLRFVLNTTIGVGGVMDPATALGVLEKPTDFGETLNVWGMPEGQYIEMPVLGPTTDRDLLGTVVDYVINPIRVFAPTPLYYTQTAGKVATKIGDRARYSETVDSLLYDSADGYAQMRLLYLENRRFQLGQPAMSDTFEDPYAQ